MKEIIKTKRLVIRKFDESDSKDVAKICSNYNVAKTTLGIPHPYTEEMAKSWIDKTRMKFDLKESYELAITLKENPDKVIGCVALMGDKEHRAELGYWIDELKWGNGYATEATETIIDFGFEKMGLKTIFGRYFDINPASGKVMEKSGLKYAGKLRNFEQRFGELYNVIYYDCTREDWLKER